ncbi:MAG: Asp23/Gls24 family envelope stress response protein [Clostridiales bacterium]|nr:Asp23/Gls24 family envelope stress response protein [Clostridiales bacterium]
MIAYETRIGTIHVSGEYLKKLIGYAASSCFGVAGMVPSGKQKFTGMVFRRKAKPPADQGIRVTGDIRSISVELHILVTYGVNINAIAKSIVHKVKYTVEETTGITVDKVTVQVDGIKAE